MARHIVFCLLLLFLNIQWVFGQDKLQPINFSEIIERSLFENPRPLVIKGREIIYDVKIRTLKENLIKKFGGSIIDEEGHLLIKRDLVISNCFVENDLDFSDFRFLRSLNMYFNTCHDIILNGVYQKVTISNNDSYVLRILYSTIQDVITIKKNTFRNVKLLNSTFNNHVNINDNQTQTDIRIFKNIFNPTTGFSCVLKSDSLFYGREFHHNIQIDINSTSDIRIEMSENIFNAEDALQRINIRGHINDLIIENNRFQSTLDLTGLAIDNRLVMVDNEFDGYISFNDLIFPEIFNLVRWDQIDEYKIIVLERLKASYQHVWTELVECNPQIMAMEDKEEKFVIPYFASNRLELSDDNAYEKMIYSYKALYNIYTNRGDLEAANASYAEMKEIQRRRLKHIYQTNGGFKNYFRWQLNLLLKVYTNHGTDPALAMVISVYVILVFGIIYFFFPSEWDVASKSQLLKNFREFVEKNEKGYFMPFLVVIKGFLVSMINALTLSLNSFITLGFGNIPTEGFARYACILEGFIGWFLLSIFTVAMINQVLA